MFTRLKNYPRYMHSFRSFWPHNREYQCVLY